ncbi:hypothetical protein AAY473_004035, partial [Plecturocebus cupreus]
MELITSGPTCPRTPFLITENSPLILERAVRLGCSGMIWVHYNLCLLGSSDSLAPVSPSVLVCSHIAIKNYLTSLILSLRLECSAMISAHCNLCLLCSIEVGFQYVGQAGLKLLVSSDPPASASQNAEITV